MRLTGTRKTQNPGEGAELDSLVENSLEQHIGGLLIKTVPMLPGERVIRREFATRLGSPFIGATFWLYLTDRRLVFASMRLDFLSKPLIVQLDDITGVGLATVSKHVVFWQYNWYVQAGNKRHYFGAIATSQRTPWPDQIAALTALPLSEPRKLYS